MAFRRFLRCFALRVLATPVVRTRVAASLAVLILAALSDTATFAQRSRETSAVAASASSSLDILMPEFEERRWTMPPTPATVVVDDDLQGIVDDLLRRSLTFRRQWYRLLRSPRLAIRVRLVHRSPVADSHAATEIIALANGSLVANVAIPGGARVAEVLGHEVEHVLERLDGARVSALHAVGDPSVRRTSGSFETARAVLVGRLVSNEFHKKQ